MKSEKTVLDRIIASIRSGTNSADWHTDAWKGPTRG